MTFIPDSISTDDLRELQVNAEPDFVPKNPEALYDGLTKEEVEELAMKTLRRMSKKCKDPMVEKCVMLAIAASWIRWHTDMAQDVMPATADSDKSEKATEYVTCLLRDAGKAQAVYSLVHDIGMDNDFVLNTDK
jgi:hypothetical protein